MPSGTPLSTEIIREVWSTKGTERGIDIAARLGLSKHTVSAIRSGRLYQDVVKGAERVVAAAPPRPPREPDITIGAVASERFREGAHTMTRRELLAARGYPEHIINGRAA